MQFIRLGRTGLKVSRLCLGTMNFGPWTTAEESFRIMDEALELGLNFFDTANVYGGDCGKGATEQIVGRWLALGEGRREKIVLATKVFGTMGDWPNQSRCSAYHIRQSCEDSLRRLQTDHLDLYQMHHIDRDTPWDEVWQAMAQLVQAGKVVYVGSSNFAAWNIAQANGIAARRNFLGLVSEQSIYNLRNRHIELEVLPCCRALGLGVIPWSPLGGGLLCGILEPAREGRRSREALVKSADNLRPQLERYEALCRELGRGPAEVALAWTLAQPGVTAPIIGPRTRAHLHGSVKALELTLGPETLQQLDAIWPGPGNQAPEAYAW